MPDTTIDQLTARERAEAWLTAGRRHAERGEDLQALGCFEVCAVNMAVSNMSDDEYCAMLDQFDGVETLCKRRLAGTLPEEVTR